MSDEHESLIKTPKQLIITVVLAFVIPIAIAVVASQLVTAGHKPTVSEETTARLIQPIARIELGTAGGGATAGAKTGEEVVQAYCAACHQSGAAGAPKLGDAAAWSPRIALGLDALTKSVVAGKGAMPPKGGGTDLTETEIARAVVAMANQAGASFEEPAAPVAAEPAAAAAAPAPPTAAEPAPTVVTAAGATAAAAAPAAEATAAPDGAQIYAAACAMCHTAGVAGAPKTGDKAAWAPRIATGADAMVNSVIHGKGAMPARGGNPKLTDDEIKATVEYLVAQAK